MAHFSAVVFLINSHYAGSTQKLCRIALVVVAITYIVIAIAIMISPNVVYKGDIGFTILALVSAILLLAINTLPMFNVGEEKATI